MAAVIHPFELIVLFFDAYRYFPGILPGDADNYLGAYVSDLIIIPATVVAIRAFSISWPARLIIVIFFTFVDWFFTVLGIYQHYWWKSIYTGFGLIVLFAISDRLWAYLDSLHPPRPYRLLTIYLTYTPLHATLNFAANRGGLLYTLQIPYWQFIGQVKLSSILVNAHLFLTATVVTLCLGLRMPFLYRIAGLGIILALNWAVGHFGLFVPHSDIFSLHLSLVPLIVTPILIALLKAARLSYLFP